MKKKPKQFRLKQGTGRKNWILQSATTVDRRGGVQICPGGAGTRGVVLASSGKKTSKHRLQHLAECGKKGRDRKVGTLDARNSTGGRQKKSKGCFSGTREEKHFKPIKKKIWGGAKQKSRLGLLPREEKKTENTETQDTRP